MCQIFNFVYVYILIRETKLKKVNILGYLLCLCTGTRCYIVIIHHSGTSLKFHEWFSAIFLISLTAIEFLPPHFADSNNVCNASEKKTQV